MVLQLQCCSWFAVFAVPVLFIGSIGSIDRQRAKLKLERSENESESKSKPKASENVNKARATV